MSKFSGKIFHLPAYGHQQGENFKGIWENPKEVKNRKGFQHP